MNGIRFALALAVIAACLGAQTSAGLVIVSAADFTPRPLAPLALAVAFGEFSGVPEMSASGQAPTELGGVRLLVDGSPAPLLHVSPRQINFQVPGGTATAESAAVQVLVSGNPVAATGVEVLEASPVLFVRDPAVPARPAAAVNGDGFPNTEASPARAGEPLRLFATGFGTAASGAVSERLTAFVRLDRAEVIAAGPAGSGLWYIDVRVPAGLPSAQLPVVLIYGGAQSNSASIWVAR